MMSVTPSTSNQNKIWSFYQLLYIFLDTKTDILKLYPIITFPIIN